MIWLTSTALQANLFDSSLFVRIKYGKKIILVIDKKNCLIKSVEPFLSA